jgi:hypothetical protein
MYTHAPRWFSCLLSGLILSGQFAFAQSAADNKFSAVAPFLDDQTIVVARLDVRQIDPAALISTLSRLAPPEDRDFPKQLAGLEQAAKAAVQVLSTFGVTELFAVVSLADLPKEPAFVLALLKSGSDSAAAAKALQQLFRFEQSESRPGLVILGKATTIERLKTLRPAARPEFAKGFERLGNSGLQLVLGISDDTRRVLREMLPRLPDEVGGGSGKVLADGLSWVAVGVQLPPKLALTATIQSRDPESAAALRGMIVSAFQLLGRQPDVRKNWPQVDDLARLMTPRLAGDQLLLNIADQSADMEHVLRLAIAPLQAARTAAGRSQSMNNLKQLALAVYNYHDRHGRFPPQAIRGKDGQALLSWRVAILPYLDAEPLYKEFQLDEPWDSDHNKKLIEKMPAVLASPDLGSERRAKGLTSYLVPLTQRPPAIAMPNAADVQKSKERGQEETVFDLLEGTKLQQITDGTSNTIMMLETNPQSAVIWTKPDDLVMDRHDLFKDLLGQPNDGFCCNFCDGSAHFLKTSLDATTFWRLLIMNDGQPVGAYH